MSEQCLELKNVCKSFRDFSLNNISFTLPQGYIMGLVGPNGAGKTTTIQLILNMLEKDTGKILVFGKDNGVIEKTPRGYFVTSDKTAVTAFRERYLASIEEAYHSAIAKVQI